MASASDPFSLGRTIVASDLRITWTLAGHGWADCTVVAHATKAELTASYVSKAPEDLLTATARIVAGEREARAQFDAEPTAFRWIFYREDDTVWLRLLELGHASDHDNVGSELLSGALGVGEVARAVVHCFDEVARAYGESGYRGKWGEHFPRNELEALRHIWQAHCSVGDA